MSVLTERCTCGFCSSASSVKARLSSSLALLPGSGWREWPRGAFRPNLPFCLSISILKKQRIRSLWQFDCRHKYLSRVQLNSEFTYLSGIFSNSLCQHNWRRSVSSWSARTVMRCTFRLYVVNFLLVLHFCYRSTFSQRKYSSNVATSRRHSRKTLKMKKEMSRKLWRPEQKKKKLLARELANWSITSIDKWIRA